MVRSQAVEVCEMQVAETILGIILTMTFTPGDRCDGQLRDHWRAGCFESCKSGSGGGRMEKDAVGNGTKLTTRRSDQMT